MDGTKDVDAASSKVKPTDNVDMTESKPIPEAPANSSKTLTDSTQDKNEKQKEDLDNQQHHKVIESDQAEIEQNVVA